MAQGDLPIARNLLRMPSPKRTRSPGSGRGGRGDEAPRVGGDDCRGRRHHGRSNWPEHDATRQRIHDVLLWTWGTPDDNRNRGKPAAPLTGGKGSLRAARRCKDPTAPGWWAAGRGPMGLLCPPFTRLLLPSSSTSESSAPRAADPSNQIRWKLEVVEAAANRCHFDPLSPGSAKATIFVPAADCSSPPPPAATTTY